MTREEAATIWDTVIEGEAVTNTVVYKDSIAYSIVISFEIVASGEAFIESLENSGNAVVIRQ